MSRIIALIIIYIAASISVAAQIKSVKDAERILGTAKPDYAAALKLLKPALSDEETKGDPAVWYNAGRAAIGVWDKMMMNVRLGQDVKPEQKKEAAQELVNAYTYLTGALPLDSLPDEKGKVKPKFSKEIYKLLAKNYGAYRNAGIFLYGLKDMNGAYDAWEIYTTMPERLNRKSRILKPDEDSDLGQIYYYQALCALSADKNAKALEKFYQARRTGYSSKELYLYGMEAARREGNESLMIDFAELGAKLYGNKEVSFFLLLINDRLKREDYEACRVLVNDALKVEADDKVKSQLYDVMGVLDDKAGKFEDALANFQKAVVYNENSAKAYFDLARIIYNESLRIAESPEEGGEERAAPGLKKAAEYFEKAYSLDEAMSQIPATLYAIYYRLGIGFEDRASYWQKRQ